MDSFRVEIEEIVNREARAWDNQVIDILISIFNPNMVWPFPKTPQSHDPIKWVLELGRYNYNRWKNRWQE